MSDRPAGLRLGLMRILLADDHQIVTKGLISILADRKDIEVFDEALDGAQAVKRAREVMPDIVILDITMPVLNGFAAAKEIRTFMPEVPILFLSTHDGRHIVNRAKAVGAQGFVSKSEAADKLLDAVDALSRNKTFFEGRDVEAGQ